MVQERGLELLSPAGNFEIFKAVVNAGADAVYFGGDAFGARAYAKNFTMEEGAQAIRFAHLYGKKAYLTVNTLIKNREMERQLYDFLRFYYEAGVDAVIVQDFGVFSFIKSFFPGLSIHASTQMTVCGASGARFLTDCGADRIVTARELSLEEISQIYRQCGCEIETFVHGALCVCYSGQCLMSSLIGGRSGNRGKCAQPCRLPYDVLGEKRQKIAAPGKYVLSPRDLCAIDLIPDLAEAGVYSLKIEGRMKQLAYAAGVVSVYRRYVDAYLEHGREGYNVSKKDRAVLVDLGSRSGFTDAYLRGNPDRGMMTFTEGAHRKEGFELELLERKLQAEGYFLARKGEPMTLRVSCGAVSVSKQGTQAVQEAKKRATSEEVIREKLHKTGDTPFVFSSLSVEADDDIFLPMTPLNELRREALRELEEALAKENGPKDRAVREFARVKDDVSNDAARDPAGEVLITVETREQFLACEKSGFVKKIAVSAELLENEEERDAVSFYYQKARSAGKQLHILLPPVLRQSAAERLQRLFERIPAPDGVIACSYDELGFLEKCGFPRDQVILDQRLYTFNHRSQNAFLEMGYDSVCAPCELNQAELAHRDNRNSYLTVYGRAVLMVTASCLVKNLSGCEGRQRVFYLKDRRGQEFPVKNHCAFCYNTIYNGKILCLFSEAAAICQMGFAGLRLDFTSESRKETAEILAEAEAAFCQGGFRTYPGEKRSDTTKGHWRRGVE